MSHVNKPAWSWFTIPHNHLNLESGLGYCSNCAISRCQIGIYLSSSDLLPRKFASCHYVFTFTSHYMPQENTACLHLISPRYVP